MPAIEKVKKKELESTVQDRILLALGSLPDLDIERNSVIGAPGSDGRMLHGGLGNGSADIVGTLALPVFVMQSGQRVEVYRGDLPWIVGVFFALEVKKSKDEVPRSLVDIERDVRERRWNRTPKGILHELDQRRWQRRKQLKGGFVAFVWSVETALAAYERAKAGELE